MEPTLHTKAYLEKQGSDYVAVGSTEVTDRQGESIVATGWDLKNYKKAPRLLWGHDHQELPIGKVTKIWIEGKKLLFKPEFQTITEFGRAVKQLVDDGFLNTFSVGFRPIDQDGNKYTKQELLEISLVNVPANQEAMMLSYKSLKTEGFDKSVIEQVGIPATLLETMNGQSEEIAKLKTQMHTVVKGLQHLNPHTGRNQRIVKDRLSFAKVAVRAADKILEDPKKSVPMAKVSKRASENLILSLKGELNGSNQRTSSKEG